MKDRALAGEREVVAVIQEGVAIELEAVAVEAIGAALDCFVNNGAGVTAILRILRAGDKGDFAEGVGVDGNALAAAAGRR